MNNDQQQLPEGEMLLYYDEKGYNNFLDSFTYLIESFEKIINLYNKMDLGLFEEKDFHRLLLDAEGLVYDKTMKKLGNVPAAIGGLTLSKSKLYDFLEKPAGYDELIKEVQTTINNRFRFKLNSLASVDFVTCRSNKELISFFTFKEGKIVLQDSLVEAAKEHFERHIRSDKAKKVFTLAKALQDAMVEADITDLTPKDRIPELLSNLVIFDGDSSNPKVNYNYILTFERN